MDKVLKAGDTRVRLGSSSIFHTTMGGEMQMSEVIDLRHGDSIELTACEDGELLIEVFEKDAGEIELIFELPQVVKLRDMLNQFIVNVKEANKATEQG